MTSGEYGGTRWTAERLRAWLAQHHPAESIVVLANRAPYRNERTKNGEVVVRRSAGGLVTALEPLISAASGVWVAHGAGTGDRADANDRDGLRVPLSSPGYRLRCVWLDAEEERRYYYGFANEGLWPLCHRVHVQPIFRSEDFDMYASVNARFVAGACDEIDTDRPLVFVQDYHLALAPRMLADRLPHSTILSFWHIPWPGPRDFAICPWGKQLVRGLLGSTILGFQTPDDCRNFIDTVEQTLNVRVDRKRSVVSYAGHRTAVREYPVSVEWNNRWVRQSPPVEACRQRICRRLGVSADLRLIVGVDRLDYTKGINEKLLAIERLLESDAAAPEQVVFVQIAEPSRDRLPAYRQLRARVVATAERINQRFGTDRLRPVVLLEARHEPAEVYEFLRAADICYVGSLHDGMNLVAKEFVCARDDGKGVLVLSRFAGAARELTDALIVNPYAIDETAQMIAKALTMPAEEQAGRMHRMRSVVANADAYRWAAAMLADAARLGTARSGRMISADRSDRREVAGSSAA